MAAAVSEVTVGVAVVVAVDVVAGDGVVDVVAAVVGVVGASSLASSSVTGTGRDTLFLLLLIS